MAFSLIIYFLTNTCHYVSEDILLFWVENPFKGVIGYDMHFYKLFEHKCVLAVCIHNQPIMIQIHPPCHPEWAVISPQLFHRGADVDRNVS